MGLPSPADARRGRAVLHLRQLADEARDGRHLFVCGMARSGTTVLRAHLERQAAFGSRRPPHSPETRIFLDPGVLFAPSSTAGQRAYRFLGDDRAAEELASLVGRWRPVHALGRWLPGRRDGFHRALGHAGLVRAFVGMAQRVHGTSRVVEKTPAHLAVVDRVLATFPRADVVVTVRHPVDRYASYRRRREGGDPADWLAVGPEPFAATYRADVANVLRWQERFAAAVHLVRYEDLVDPEHDRVGRLLHAVDVRPDTVAPDDTDLPMTARAIRPTARSWRDVLHHDEARDLEALTADQMAALGYAPYVTSGERA